MSFEGEKSSASRRSGRRQIGGFLRFKEEYLERVLRGEKRVTIRRGIVHVTRQLVYVVCCDKIFGEAIIDKVEYTKLNSINSYIMRQEGVSNMEELLNEIKKLYPNIKLNDNITIIYFTLIRKYEKPVDVEFLKFRRG